MRRYIRNKAISFQDFFIIPIVLIAIGVRLWGIEAGLPVIYHPDEPEYVRIAQGMFKSGDLNPHVFSYPSLFFYLNALAYVPFYLGGKLTGAFHSRGDLVGPESFIQGVSITALPDTVMLGRLLSLCFSAGSVILVYMIGRQLLKSREAGLLAASLMAVSTPSVINSRTITPDSSLVFFMLFAFWGAVQVFERPKRWNYVVAGVGIGLVGSAKYNGVLIAIILIGAHFLRYGLRGFKDTRLYLAGLVSTLVFLMTTPYALLDYSTFITDVQHEAQHYSSGHLGMEGETLSFYLEYFRTIEGPIILLALLEIVRGFVTKSKPIILLSLFPLIYFLFITQFTVRNDRTLLPMLPFAYLLGASFIVNLGRARLTWVKDAWRPAARWLLLTALIPVVAASVLFPAEAMAKATDSRLNGISTRQEAMEWISQNAPSGSRIALDAYGPYVDPKRYSVSGTPITEDHPPEWYAQNLDYVIFSKFTFRRFYDSRERFPDEVRRYDYMFKAFDQVKVFPHEDYEIRIYRVPKS